MRNFLKQDVIPHLDISNFSQQQQTSLQSLLETNSQKDETPMEIKKTLGQETYDIACKICHDQGVAGAPKIEDSQAWEARLKQGIDQLFAHANEGFQGTNGFMPAKGEQRQLTEKQVNDAVEYILIKNNLQMEKQ